MDDFFSFSLQNKVVTTECIKESAKEDITARENELFVKIKADFEENPQKISSSLRELQRFLYEKKGFIQTCDYISSNIPHICFTYITESEANRENAIRLLMCVIVFDDVKGINELVDSNLFDVIDFLLRQGQKCMIAGLAYLSNICFYKEMHEIVLRSFDFNEIIELIDFSTNDCTGYIIFDLCDNLRDDFPDDCLLHFFNKIISIYDSIPTKAFSTFLSIVGCLLKGNNRESVLSNINISGLITLLIDKYDLSNPPNENELIYVKILKFFIDADVTFNTSDLIAFLNNQTYKPLYYYIMYHIWNQIMKVEENIELRNSMVEEFFENGGFSIVERAMSEGTYKEMKYAIFLLGAKISITEDHSFLLEFFDPQWISQICDALNDDDTDILYVQYCISILAWLIKAEEGLEQKNFFSAVKDSQIEDALRNYEEVESLAPYVEIMNELLEQDESE